MPVTIVVPKEIKDGEQRVAMVPSLIDKFKKLGAVIKIEHDAGVGIDAADSAFLGADVEANAAALYASGDVVIKIQPPTSAEIEQMREGSILISTLYAHLAPEILKQLCAKKITSFALELIPRISRAQSMDVLSSQATIIGYRAVLEAATNCKFFFPMLTTAAGTMRPAKVLVIGAGVAGLQAIATARRLGARIEAYDVRPETKTEVESLGAKFVDTGVTAVGEGGYARELTAEEKQQQIKVLGEHIAASDIVITTAGVPGKPAPKIITKEMVEGMKPGSVIVDIMAENGGNCEFAKPGETVVHNGVAIVGAKDMASTLSTHASEMFARNVLNFITPMFKDNNLNIDWDDEVFAGCVATRDGEVVNVALKKLMEG